MGRLGKDKSPVWLMGVVGLSLALASCAGGRGAGRFAGPLDAESGQCGLVSGGQHLTGSLLIRDGAVIFAPDSGVVVLRGRIDEAGHVEASLTTPGADHKPFLMVFEGDLRDGVVEGRYATPQCRARVRLQRAD